MVYKDFTDFLQEKFFKDEPMTLDDDWPEYYSDWLEDLDCDMLVRYAEEYASHKVIEALGGIKKTLTKEPKE